MRALALLLLGLFWLQPAAADRILVGPERAVKLPSDALRQAADGDVIAIDEGEYFDCLRLRVDGLTIEGQGAGAVLTDLACDGKAIIVATADRIVLRNLTLQRARVPDGNGAGIRAEGPGLTIENVRFVNNQAGVIAGDAPNASITIRDALFSATGRCDVPRCANAITVGRLKSLVIERSRLTGTIGAHMIVSAAAQTRIVSSIIEDGAKGSASFQVIIATGNLVMEDNVVQKGPQAANRRGAVQLSGRTGGEMVFRRNSFINDTGASTPFVLDWSDATLVMERNIVALGDSEVSTSGSITHRVVDAGHTAKDFVAKLVGYARKVVSVFLR